MPISTLKAALPFLSRILLLLGATILVGGSVVVGATEASALTPALGLHAYANGAAVSPTACPQTAVVADQCTLTEALALASGAGPANVYLETDGTSGHYIGNFTIDNASVILEPGSGVANPVLDGNLGNASGCPTSACDGPVLTISSGATASLVEVMIEAGANTTGNGGGIENDGGLTTMETAITGNVTGAGGAGGGIDNTGSLTLENSNVLTNRTGAGKAGCDANAPGCSDPTGGNSADGGGIENTGTATITNSTISGNTTGNAGGGGLGSNFSVHRRRCRWPERCRWRDRQREHPDAQRLHHLGEHDRQRRQRRSNRLPQCQRGQRRQRRQRGRSRLQRIGDGLELDHVGEHHWERGDRRERSVDRGTGH